jgi:transposase
MICRQRRDQGKLFYEFRLEDRIPENHLLRRINVFVTTALADLHKGLETFYSDIGRPSVDPELMIRMLVVGYCYGIRSERRLTQEVELHLAYRWFCKLDLDDEIPHHSTFSLNRLDRFRESDVLRHIFERVVWTAMAMRSDPSSAWTAKANKRVQFGYGLNYLIDIENAVIVDVEATPARTYDEVLATRTMIERTAKCFDLKPKRLAADTAYGTGKFLGWLAGEKITPHIPVWDRSEREDGTYSRSDFKWHKRRGLYVCPNGKVLRTSGTIHDGKTLLYRASKRDCDVCPLKMRCCPKEPSRKIPRDLHEDARDVARRLMGTPAFIKSRDERKRVEMRFAHRKTHHGFERLRLRGLSGARDEFHLAAIVQNLKTLALRLVWPPPDLAAASVA